MRARGTPRRYTDVDHFPTYNESGFAADVRGLEQWLDRALSDTREEVDLDDTVPFLQGVGHSPSGRMQGAEDQLHFDAHMWGCYSPWNAQARTLLEQDSLRSSPLSPSWSQVQARHLLCRAQTPQDTCHH